MENTLGSAEQDVGAYNRHTSSFAESVDTINAEDKIQTNKIKFSIEEQVSNCSFVVEQAVELQYMITTSMANIDVGEGTFGFLEFHVNY